MFDEIDTDHSGSIDFSEFKQCINKCMNSVGYLCNDDDIK